MRRRAALAFAVLVAAALAGLPSGGARAAVPAGWVGTMADGPLVTQPGLLAAEVPAMRSAGVQGLRTTFYWSQGQWCADCPLRPAAYDGLVGAAARGGLRLLPVVVGAPAWAADRSERDILVPRDPATLGRFMRLLVGRYGPSGSFWAEHPELPRRPIRAWQIWNEPELTYFIPHRGWAARYVGLLRAAARAVRATDHHAQVVLAGLTGTSWKDLGAIYRAGGRRLFDVAALHPYTARPADVLRVVRRGRAVMRAHGDATKPVRLTEVGWPAARAGRIPIPSWCAFCVGERDQATRTAQLVGLVGAARRGLRIAGIDVYTWLSSWSGTYPFNYSGLRSYDGLRGHPTPALDAFTRAVHRLR